MSPTPWRQRYQRRRRQTERVLRWSAHFAMHMSMAYCQPSSPNLELARQGSALQEGGRGVEASSKDQKKFGFWFGFLASSSDHFPGSVGKRRNNLEEPEA